MIGFVNPTIIFISKERTEIQIRLKRRTKNHLKSMYFGSLCVGFDVAAGILVLYIADLDKYKISFAFKSLQVNFRKRPYSDVTFECADGEQISSLLKEAKLTGKRLNKELVVNAFNLDKELVASSVIEVSIKVLG